MKTFIVRFVGGPMRPVLATTPERAAKKFVSSNLEESGRYTTLVVVEQPPVRHFTVSDILSLILSTPKEKEGRKEKKEGKQ